MRCYYCYYYFPVIAICSVFVNSFVSARDIFKEHVLRVQLRSWFLWQHHLKGMREVRAEL